MNKLYTPLCHDVVREGSGSVMMWFEKVVRGGSSASLFSLVREGSVHI